MTHTIVYTDASGATRSETTVTAAGALQRQEELELQGYVIVYG